MAKKSELWIGVTSGAVSGALVLILDKTISADGLPLLIKIALVVLGATALWLGQHYYSVLGGAASSDQSEERQQFDALCQRIATGGTPAKVYNRWLEAILSRVDHFFGDAGRANTSWIARALGLDTNGPRWTAASYDRCLLLALVYPVVTIFTVWAFSGHVGVAERAFFLPPENLADRHQDLRRAVFFLLMLFTVFAFLRSLKGTDVKSWLWTAAAFAAVAAGSFAVAYGDLTNVLVRAFAGLAFAFALTLGIAGVGSRIGIGAYAVAMAVAAAVTMVIVIVASVTGTYSITIFIVLATAVIVVGGVGTISILVNRDRGSRAGYLGRFLILFSIAVGIACLVLPWVFASKSAWHVMGTLILFYGVLTLVNAPVDWLAVGFTRALLRRGLALGGWWPFLFALIDVLVACVLIAILAFVMVLAVQTFDDVGALRAGPNARILPLMPLFHGLETDPNDYEYWWIWFLLFSSMIPSMLNLSVACAAFLRGLPPVNRLILRRLSAGVSNSNRLAVAAVLTAQPIGGMVLTSVAAYLVAVYLLPLGLPAFGGVVRDFAEALSDYNAPGQLLAWLNGST